MQINYASTAGGKRLKGILAENSVELPLVSVITVIFNGRVYVEACLQSVLQQDYPNIEHIVMDGGSSDGTLDVLRQYDDEIAFWKSEPDKGIYDAWNKSLREARGEWICFLGVDDEFLPGAISAYMALADRYPQAEYLSSKVNWVHPSGYSRILGGPWEWPKFSKVMCSAHVGSMHRRRLFDALGNYDISYRMVADYELLLRAQGKLKTAFMPLTTVMMRAGGITDSSFSLAETMKAKINTGGRPALLARLEYWISKLKIRMRPARYRAQSIFRRPLP
jgi:glycosyltransferase involved in cell wall biosynthesis